MEGNEVSKQRQDLIVNKHNEAIKSQPKEGGQEFERKSGSKAGSNVLTSG